MGVNVRAEDDMCGFVPDCRRVESARIGGQTIFGRTRQIP